MEDRLTHDVTSVETPRVRPLMVAPAMALALAALVGFLVALAGEIVSGANGPAPVAVLLEVLGNVVFWPVLLLLIFRRMFRNGAEREHVAVGKVLARDALVLHGIACPTCHVQGQVTRAVPQPPRPAAQFACRRCGFIW